jgi:hypothetical protein
MTRHMREARRRTIQRNPRLHSVRRVASISGEHVAAAVLGPEAQRIQPNAEVDFPDASEFYME